MELRSYLKISTSLKRESIFCEVHGINLLIMNKLNKECPLMHEKRPVMHRSFKYIGKYCSIEVYK